MAMLLVDNIMKARTLIDLEHELHETARRNARYSDFGDLSYREGLHVLLEAFEFDRRMTATGRRYAYRTILTTLTARLHTQKAWAEHPEVLGMPVQRPLVIAGLPRTGT